MKKRVLKGWVEKFLMILNLVSIIILASEVTNGFVFITSKIIATMLLCASTLLINKYGKEN